MIGNLRLECRLAAFEEAKQVLSAFERTGVRYVLVGSMAMAVQGLVRATRPDDPWTPDLTNATARETREYINADFLKKLAWIEEQEDVWFDCIDRKKWDTFDTVCLKRYEKESK